MKRTASISRIASFFLLFSFLIISQISKSQPFQLEGDFGLGWTTYVMEDRGSVMGITAQSNISGPVTFLFNNAGLTYSPKWCGSTTDYIRDINSYMENSAYIYTGGGWDKDLEITTNNIYYYTFNIGKEAGANNNLCILETDFEPGIIDSVSVPTEALSTNSAYEVSVRMDRAKNISEKLFLRWTNNNWNTSTFIEIVALDGLHIGTATIPEQSTAATIKYYALTTNQSSLSDISADFYSLNMNNNSGSYYEYSVLNDTAAIIVADSVLNEQRLDFRILALAITGETFADETLDPFNFSLNNAPTGTTIESVNWITVDSAEVALAFDGTDFDSDSLNFSITISGAEISGGTELTSNTLIIYAYIEPMPSAAISPDSVLYETFLDSRSLDLILMNETFADGVLNPANFSLNNAPAGLTVGAANYYSPTTASIELTFDGTDFDADSSHFSITIDGSELTLGSNITTNELVITADLEISYEGIDSAKIAINDGAFSYPDPYSFDGSDLGTFNSSGTLVINSAQLFVWKNNTVGGDITQCNFHYRIYKEGDTPGAFTDVQLPWFSNNDQGDYTYQLWWNDSPEETNFDVLSVANTAGIWNIEIYWDATGAHGAYLYDNGGSNFKAQFTYEMNAYATMAELIPPLEEAFLHGATVIIDLHNETFVDNIFDIGNFTLNNAPAGVTVMSINSMFPEETRCDLSLAYDWTDFTANYPDFSVTIGAAELSSGQPLTTNTLIIYAEPEPEGLDSSKVAIDNGTEIYYNASEFDGLNLGTFDETGTLILNYGQEFVWKNTSVGGDIVGCSMFYRIYSEFATPGSFDIVELPWVSNDVQGDTTFQLWWNQDTPLDLDLIAAATDSGKYFVEIYFEADGSNIYEDNNSGLNYIAEFLYQPTQVVTTPGATFMEMTTLIEDNLDGALGYLTLNDDTFIDDILDSLNFTLNSAPAGVKVLPMSPNSFGNQNCALMFSFDGTDFDEDSTHVTVSISGNELNGGTLIYSNEFTIRAVLEPVPTEGIDSAKIAINNGTTSYYLSENFDGADLGTVNAVSTLTLESGQLFVCKNETLGGNITGCSMYYRMYKDGNAPGNFDTIALPWFSNNNQGDYNYQLWWNDSPDQTNFNLVLAAGENGTYNVEVFFEAFNGAVSYILDNDGANYIAQYTYFDNSASLIATTDAPLIEFGLNDMYINLDLQNEKFVDNVFDNANFTLNNAPPGLTIASVYADFIPLEDSTYAELTLSFDGTDFLQVYNNFSVTINANELQGNENLTSNTLTILSTEVYLTDSMPEGLDSANIIMNTGTLQAFKLSQFDGIEFMANQFDILTLNSTELFVWKRPSLGGDITGCSLFYSVYDQGGTPGAFTEVPIPWYSNNDLGEMIYQTWWNDAPDELNLDLLNLVGNYGQYVLEIYFELYGADSTYLINNFGNNYAAGIIYEELLIPSAEITADSIMEELTLDNRSLTIDLTYDSFVDDVLNQGNFTLNNAPIGLTIESLSYINSIQAIINLAFDGTDFSSEITDFSVTIAASELNSASELTSNNLLITAYNEVSYEGIDSAKVAIETGTLTYWDAAAFDGADLGTFNEASTLKLNSGQLFVWKDWSIGGDITSCSMNYRVFKQGDTPGVFTTEALPWFSNNDQGNYTYQLWWNDTPDETNFDLLSTVSGAGTYFVEVYFEATGANGNYVLDNGGSNFVAQFSYEIVPSVEIAADSVLEEINLDSRQLTIALHNETFADNTLDQLNFTLNNVPAGTSIESVTWISSDSALVNLAFDGTDFASDHLFNLTIAAAEFTGGNDLTSNDLTIYAFNNVIAEGIDSAKVAINSGSGNEYLLAENFDGHSFGTFDASGTLILNSGQMFVWKNISESGDITSCTMNYRIYKQGNTPGSFTQVALPWFSNNEQGNYTNQLWWNDDPDATDFNILALGNSNGTWNIEVYFEAETGSADTIYLNNGGANYIATYTFYTGPAFSITPDATLAENYLNGRVLTLNLDYETFADSTLLDSNFVLNNYPSGLSIDTIEFIDSVTATLTLAFDGTDFSVDYPVFSITINGEELTGANDLTSNSLIIYAASIENPCPPIFTLGNDTAICGGGAILLDPGITISPYGDSLTITYDATKGQTDLPGASKVYMHAGVELHENAGWQYTVGNWAQDDGIGKMTSIGTDLWQITINPQSYFGYPADSSLWGILVVFRNEDGTATGKNELNEDIWIDMHSNPPVCNFDGVDAFFEPTIYSSIQWSDGSIGNTLTVTNSGTYSVTITNIDGCSGSDTIVVGLGEIPTIFAGNDTTFCTGGSVEIGIGGYQSYIWTEMSSGTEVGIDSILTVTETGIYRIAATNEYGCTGYDLVLVDVVSPPVAEFIAAIDALNVSFADSSEFADSYSWDFNGDGTEDSSTPGDVSYAYTTAGQYYVTLVVSNSCSTDSYSQFITVSGSGIDEITSGIITRVYPNPTKDFLTIETNQDITKELKIKILDITGREVSEDFGQFDSTNQKTLDISTLTPGTYIIEIMNQYSVIGKSIIIKK